jgi:D-lactate dehydrogenase
MVETLANLGIRLIALRSAGYNNLDLAAAVRRGLAVVYVPTYTPHSVAEHVFALTLALLRHVPRAVARTRDANFDVDGLVGTLLHGRTFGVVGLGKIGRVVTSIATGFGCTVVAHDPHANPPDASRSSFTCGRGRRAPAYPSLGDHGDVVLWRTAPRWTSPLALAAPRLIREREVPDESAV